MKGNGLLMQLDQECEETPDVDPPISIWEHKPLGPNGRQWLALEPTQREARADLIRDLWQRRGISWKEGDHRRSTLEWIANNTMDDIPWLGYTALASEPVRIAEPSHPQPIPPTGRCTREALKPQVNPWKLQTEDPDAECRAQRAWYG
jgi:hypothetical protein